MILSKEERGRLKKLYGDDKVFIALHEELRGVPNKFKLSTKDTVSLLRRTEHGGRYVMRYDAESNPAFQQIMGMSVIVDKKNEKFFITKPHHKVSVEKRGSYQMCFGKRVDPADQRSIVKASLTALEEHFDLELKPGAYLFGTIRDLMKDPGITGFVFINPVVKVKMKPVKGRIGKWMSQDELVESYFYFDSWSQMIIDHLFSAKNRGVI